MKKRAVGLLQVYETLGPWRSPSLGRERCPVSPRSTAGVAHPGRAIAPLKSSPFPVGSSPSATGNHFPVPCKPTGLHHRLTVRKG